MIRLKGFTLIELMVVIAIIGILATIITASLGSAKAKGRDAKRIADIKTIQSALALYYNDNQFYPANIYTTYNKSDGVSAADGLAPVYLPSVPTDPSASISYTTCASSPNTAGCYSYIGLNDNGGSACLTSRPPTLYHLGVSLEDNSNNTLINDADASVGGAGATGIMAGFTRCTNLGSADFSGLSYTKAPALCNSSAGAAQPNTGSTAETCYDWTP